MLHTIDLRSHSITSAKAAVVRLESARHFRPLRFLLPTYGANWGALYRPAMPVTVPTMLGYGWQRPLTWGLNAHL